MAFVPIETMTQISDQQLPGVERGFTTVAGVKTRYLAYGSGETVLLIHGWMGSSIDFPTLFPFLAKNFRVISFDLPGFGESGRLSSYTIHDYANFVAAFVRVMNLDKFYLVGNCFGASIALDYVINDPDRAQKLVAFTPIYAKDVLRRGFRTVASLMRHHYFRMALGRFFRSDRPMRFAISKVLAHARGAYKEDAITKKRQVYLPAAAQSASDLLKIDLREGMKGIKIPTLVIFFERDHILIPDAVTHIRQYIPQVEFVEAFGKGHFADPDLMLPEYEKILGFLNRK